MSTVYLKKACRGFVFSILFTLLGYGVAHSQVPVSTTLSTQEPAPNETFTLTLSIDEPADLYSFSIVVGFNADQLEFISNLNINITGDGIQFSGEFIPGQFGVAVSRTDGLPSIQSGEFMELTFRVRPMAAAAPLDFTFTNPQMTDSNGDDISFDEPDPVQLDVAPGIGAVELISPEVNKVQEGEPFYVSGRIYASGITHEPGNEGRILAWVGANSQNSDPAGWDESAWRPMEFDGAEEPFYTYLGETALFRERGTYSVAIRTQLDDGPYFHGGVDGFWDAVSHPSATLEIEQLPDFRYTIAGWDFAYGKLEPALSVPDNDLAELETSGPPLTDDEGILDTTESGGITYLSTKGWHEEGGDSKKYLHVSLSTLQFRELELNSSHTGTPAGPRSFAVQIKQEGGEWEDLPGGEIDLAENTTVHLHNLEIPAAYNDQEVIHLRWLRGEDERIGEEGASISNAGFHRIGDIRLTGLNINPQRVDVLPGDVNEDGIVDAQDVLVLAHYWLSRGPAPVYDRIGFEPREVEEWIPGPATHADTNGDGIVNQEDLMPLGLNFGKTAGMEPASVPEPLVRMEVPQLRRGEEARLVIRSSNQESFKGIAYRLTASGPGEEEWEVMTEYTPGWGEDWDEQERLLVFGKRNENAFEKAYSVLGRNTDRKAKELAGLTIRATADWSSGAIFSLEWVAASRMDGTIDLLTDIQAGLSDSLPGGPGAGDPLHPGLHQNYPNPFNLQTNIRYDLSDEADVRLEVYDVAGKQVATLVDSKQDRGSYLIIFDSGSLASGVYLYRLLAGNTILTRSMVLVR